MRTLRVLTVLLIASVAAAQDPSMVFATKPAPEALAVARLGNATEHAVLTIGARLAVIDMQTGHVELNGDPNEAARIFWQAVERMAPVGKECPK